MAEFAVVDQIDAGVFLLLHDLADGVLQLGLVRRLVEFFAERALLAHFEKLRRPRQAADMRGQNPIGHIFPPDFIRLIFLRALRRTRKTPRAIGKVYRMRFAVGKVRGAFAR